MIEHLAGAGVPVHVIANTWGFERDYQVATCRAVVNISKYDDSILEVYRLWHSLCLGTPAMSEKGADRDLAEWRNYVLFVDSLDAIAESGLPSMPDASAYRIRTSFDEEIVRLRKWLESL